MNIKFVICRREIDKNAKRISNVRPPMHIKKLSSCLILGKGSGVIFGAFHTQQETNIGIFVTG